MSEDTRPAKRPLHIELTVEKWLLCIAHVIDQFIHYEITEHDFRHRVPECLILSYDMHWQQHASLDVDKYVSRFVDRRMARTELLERLWDILYHHVEPFKVSPRMPIEFAQQSYTYPNKPTGFEYFEATVTKYKSPVAINTVESVVFLQPLVDAGTVRTII